MLGATNEKTKKPMFKVLSYTFITINKCIDNCFGLRRGVIKNMQSREMTYS